MIILATLLSSAVLGSCGGAGERGAGGDTQAAAPAGKTFFVSPDGDDENDGSADSPLATPKGAAGAVRGFREANGLPDGGIEVVFAPGTYRIDSQTVLAGGESGETGKEVIFRAAPGGEVIFDGGITIDPALFVPASVEAKSIVPDGEVRDHLLEADLAAAGCYDLDDSAAYERRWYCFRYRQELYVDNERQNVARWPDSGYEVATIFKPSEEERQYFLLPEGKTDSWSRENIRYYGYQVYEWDLLNLSENDVRIDAADSRMVFLADGPYEINKLSTSTYFVYNLMCELDHPGEYYWDTARSMLYYYPDGDISGRKISFSQFDDYWYSLEGASHISFEGITFENGRANVFCGDADDISFRNCVFRDQGGYAIYIKGSHITVENCVFTDLGSGSIYLEGGNEGDLAASGSVIRNCLFHEFSQTYKVYNAALRLYGYGYHVLHNEFCESAHQAIAFNCGGSLFEYNYIHEICTETNDAGAVYSYRRWDWNDNVFRFNLIENVIDRVGGGMPSAFYLDDLISDQVIYGNIMANVGGRGILVNGGRNNRIENNIFINISKWPVDYYATALGRYDGALYPDGWLWKSISSNSDYLSDMRRFAVPVHLVMIEQTYTNLPEHPDDPGTPSYGVLRNNIGYMSRSFGADDEVDAFGTVEANLLYSEDPGFNDVQNGDYSLRADSRVFRDLPGFCGIDFDSIGVQK